MKFTVSLNSFIGVANAYSAVSNFYDGDYGWFVISLIITLWVASWE